MGRTVTKSIAIIGEGETEWFYFDSLRIACRYPFKVVMNALSHSGINKKYPHKNLFDSNKIDKKIINKNIFIWKIFQMGLIS